MDSNIVITGIGIVSSKANSKNELINKHFIGETIKEKEFDPSEELGKRGHKYFISSTKYLLVSIKRLLIDNSYDADYESHEVGVIIGTNFSNRKYIENNYIKLQTEGLASIEPMFAPNLSVNLSGSIASIKYNFKGSNITLTNNLLAGIQSIEVGMQQLNNNRIKMAICGATEGIAPSSITKYIKKPLLEESSCVISLEKLNDATKRKSPIYGVINGMTNSYFPYTEEIPKNLSRLQTLLERDIDSVIEDKTREINLYLTNCLSPFSEIVNKTIMRLLQKAGITYYEIDSLGNNYENISVSPILLTAHSVINKSKQIDSLIVCSNPQGNINMLSISKMHF